MAEQNELKKLADIATDLGITAELRIKALEMVGKMGTHEALLVLLGVAGNEKMIRKERDLALKYAREIIKADR